VQNPVQFSVLVVVVPEKCIWPRGQRAAEELRDNSPSSVPNFVRYPLPKNLLPSRMRLTGCGVKTRIVVLSVRKVSDRNALPAIRSQESFCSLPYYNRWPMRADSAGNDLNSFRQVAPARKRLLSWYGDPHQKCHCLRLDFNAHFTHCPGSQSAHDGR
jgi:hypothetical protein